MVGIPWAAHHLIGFLAQVPVAGSGEPSSLAQYGILGAIITAIVGALGWVFRWALTGERARGDRLERVVLDLNEYIRDRAVPALEAVATSNAEVARGNQDVAKLLALLLHERGQAYPRLDKG